MKAVVCQKINKEFGDGDSKIHVLKDIDWTVNYGEMTFLIGPSGSGKTTLISVIAGLLNASSGSVEILGEDYGAMSGEEQIIFRRRNLGFIFQQYNLLPSLTAAENASVPLLAGGMHRKQAIEQARELLRTLGMADRTEMFPRQLSGGQQQRVSIARALVHSPKLVVCDEPTAALDQETGKTVMELLKSSSTRFDRAVIVVTHDNRIYDFADRITEIQDGIIIKQNFRSKL